LTLQWWQALVRRLQMRVDMRQEDHQQARQTYRQLEEWVRGRPREALAESMDCVVHAQSWLGKLDGWCDEHMGADAPGFGVLTVELDKVAQALQALLAMLPQVLVRAEPAAEASEQTAAAEAAQPLAVLLELQGREEAYRQLQRIADYLARTEPHSPVPYLIYRAVEWGHKPLRELLAELIDSDAEARRLWSLLGVLP
jgi:type VI secretion system protein ImpA